MTTLPFQLDRPTFVRVPFFTRGKTWTQGEHFPWKEMNVPQDIAQILFNNGQLIHNSASEVKMQVGDGLEAIDLTGLRQIVEDYSARVKAVTRNDTEFKRRKPPLSTVADRQRALIRTWRANNLNWLEKAEQNK